MICGFKGLVQNADTLLVGEECRIYSRHLLSDVKRADNRGEKLLHHSFSYVLAALLIGVEDDFNRFFAFLGRPLVTQRAQVER